MNLCLRNKTTVAWSSALHNIAFICQLPTGLLWLTTTAFACRGRRRAHGAVPAVQGTLRAAGAHMGSGRRPRRPAAGRRAAGGRVLAVRARAVRAQGRLRPCAGATVTRIARCSISGHSDALHVFWLDECDILTLCDACWCSQHGLSAPAAANMPHPGLARILPCGHCHMK